MRIRLSVNQLTSTVFFAALSKSTLSASKGEDRPTTLRLSSPRRETTFPANERVRTTPRPGSRVPITARPTPITAAPTHSSEEAHPPPTSTLGSDISRFLSSSLMSTNIMDTSETPVAVVTTTNPLRTSTTTTTTTSTSTESPEDLFKDDGFDDYATYLPNVSGSRHDVLITTHQEGQKFVPRIPPGAKSCPPQLMRTIDWPRTLAGKTAAIPCPLSTQGMATWECSEAGKWSSPRPDLSNCRSLWLSKIHEQLRSPLPPVHLAKETAHYANSNALFGGDISALLSAMGALAEKMEFSLSDMPTDLQKEAVVVEIVQALMKSGSLMMEPRNRPAWMDLSEDELSRTVTTLARTLKASGLLLPKAAKENQEITVSSPNICKLL